MKRTIFILALALSCVPGLLFAQARPQAATTATTSGGLFATLVYSDNYEGITVRSTASPVTELAVAQGMSIPQAYTIQTAESTTAEIRLPNNSIIRMADRTSFTINILATTAQNSFELGSGRIRAVAARIAGVQVGYLVRAGSTVCGIRGTDWVQSNLPDQGTGRPEVYAACLNGLLNYYRVDANNNQIGDAVDIPSGSWVDALTDVFQAAVMTQQMIEAFQNEFQFTALNPNDVEGHGTEVAQTTEPTNVETPVVETPTTETPTTETPTTETPTTPETPAMPEWQQRIYDWLIEYMGMQVGTIMVPDDTGNLVLWQKAVLQPNFEFGAIKLGLYLPVIYASNLFDPEDWYHPRGNDEWSFGTDQDDTSPTYVLDIIGDVVSDLFLKIRYFQYAEQRDPFFVKVGNIHDMTLGHGILMSGFANDADFPAVRRIGVQLGINGEKVGLELVANDLSLPEIFGARFFFKPAAFLAFGPSVVVDLNPASELNETQAAATGNPIFFNAAFDLDVPIIETDVFSIVLFADVAGMVPYFRDAVGTSIAQGFAFDTFVQTDPFRIRNYGVMAGVFGNIFMVPFRLEYRRFNGTFRPAFYDANYDRSRSTYALELADYMANRATIDAAATTVSGIYGESGFSIADAFSLELGYMWPWGAADVPDEEIWYNDYLHLAIALERGVIPGFDMGLSIAYDKTGLVGVLRDRATSGITLWDALFDANTVVRTELTYGLFPGLDLAVVFTTSLKRDDTGSIVMGTNGLPEIANSVSIETRLGN